MKKIAVVGAGISGISCAKMLHDLGLEVTVFEKNSVIGGLVSCDTADKNLYHKVGGHVFNSKNSNVLDWFWKQFDKNTEFIKAERNAVIYLENKFISYPIELNLSDLDSNKAEAVIADLLQLTKSPLKDPLSFCSLKDFLKSSFGDTLFELYFKPYNTKIWNRSLDQIGMEWLKGKLPMTSAENIIKQNILKQKDSMVHSSFYYPVEGGSQFIVERLAQDLHLMHESVDNIRKINNKYYINNSSKEFDALIFTGNKRTWQ